MSLIGRFEHLPKRPKSDDARWATPTLCRIGHYFAGLIKSRPLLEKIASQVKPIMSKRDWKVGTLAEVSHEVSHRSTVWDQTTIQSESKLTHSSKFLPSDPSLLGNNMNRGERINLRLRPPGDPNGFYEYDQLVLIMLHEVSSSDYTSC